MMDVAVDLELDLKGMRCPLPLLKAKQAMSQLGSGQMLKVQATDPGSVRDFASYARIAGHELVVSDEVSGAFIFVLKHK
ncbi:sulfurtransferase TusA family protein [Endozoicomonas sp.]|nr:sulfurtransferase TusA family protein [Endozoicomonas sp.]